MGGSSSLDLSVVVPTLGLTSVIRKFKLTNDKLGSLVLGEQTNEARKLRIRICH